jgi:1-acyl-sn-glycerol-3-phosphate acyltransferase
MRSLRALGRLALLILLFLGLYTSWMLGSGLLLLFGGGRRRWRNGHFQRWTGGILRILGIRVQSVGPIPRPPFVLVTNHLSYVDVLVLASLLPDTVFVAKSEVATWPVIGHLCRGMGTLFVDRGSRRDVPRMVAEMRKCLADGWGVVLFAEGTSTLGATVGPFRPSLLEAPAASGLPVHYAALSYRTTPPDEAADTAICWWGEMDFSPHLWKLAHLSQGEARVDFASEPVLLADRKLLARALHQGVLSIFRPTSPPGEVV